MVDDAIVVVENVERNMHDHGLQPRAATIKSMDGNRQLLVAIVLVMASVFIPPLSCRHHRPVVQSSSLSRSSYPW